MSCNDSLPPPSSAEPTIAELATRVARLEKNQRAHREILGSAPDLLSNKEGDGLIQAFFDLRDDFRELGGQLAALAKMYEADIAQRKAAAEAEALAKKERREPWSKAAWIFLGSAIGTVTSGGLAGMWYWLTHR